MKSSSLPLVFSTLTILLATHAPAIAQDNTLTEIATGVFFHQGDNRMGHSNNGWVILAEYTLVIDANYPSGAHVIMPKIKETTDIPVRVVFDTHHHADHAYGNRLWAEAGALLVAQVGVADQMKLTEPAEYIKRAALRPDLRTTSLEAPSVLFRDELVFDDGTRRVELRFFGAGHTPGDGFAWLPHEKILFTGDAAVNGAYNYMGDANIASWIKALDAAEKLGAQIVCPGHGPAGGPEIIVDQRRFLQELYDRVKALRSAGKSPADARTATASIGDELQAIKTIARYVGSGLPAQTERVWTELGGAAFPR